LKKQHPKKRITPKQHPNRKNGKNKYHTGEAGGFISALKGHFTSRPLRGT
jgi:hypothetical protein